jgi:alkylhydroperoxidase family enzyme
MRISIWQRQATRCRQGSSTTWRGPAVTDGAVFTDVERVALAFTDAVVREVKAPQALYDRLAAHLGPQWQIELLMTIGFYMMVSRLLENLEVELEETNVEHLEVPRD